MLSIAALAFEKQLSFDYYVRYIPKHIKDDYRGNIGDAIKMGMNLIVQEAQNDELLGQEVLKSIDPASTLFIPQGGASHQAYVGIKRLAKEILEWKEASRIGKLYIATPSGTGTTAWHLQNILEKHATVLTTPVVGTSAYLMEQVEKFGAGSFLPTILETQKKYRFAKPDDDLLKQYKDFLVRGITFDLIYAPVMLQALEDNKEVWEDGTLLYVHSGGVSGNVTQEDRY